MDKKRWPRPGKLFCSAALAESGEGDSGSDVAAAPASDADSMATAATTDTADPSFVANQSLVQALTPLATSW